jgi:hypothetical protein
MNKGVIKFRVEVCESCRGAGRDHAKFHMKDLLFAEYRMIRIPGDCGCVARAVGDCALCGKRAQDLGVAGEKHMDIMTESTAKVTRLDGGAEITAPPITKSICGHCVTRLAITFQEQANIPGIQALIDACQPKIIPASGAAKLGPFPGGH